MKLLKLVPADTNIKFLKFRMPFFILSLILIGGSWAAVLTQGLNYGVDFAGGQEVRLTFTQMEQAPVADLRQSLARIRHARRAGVRRSQRGLDPRPAA